MSIVKSSLNQSIALKEYKRTKIIATVGPATNDYETIRSLIDAGANGLRLNFSHGSHDEHAKRIRLIRRASRELDKPVAIIQDLQGPKIRLGDLAGEVVVSAGQNLRLAHQPPAAEIESGLLPTQFDLAAKVKPGESLYLFDGKVRCTIVGVKAGIVTARAENSGVLLPRKGINLPDTDFSGDVITAKDIADLKFGADQKIDYVAMSFVQSAADIERLRGLIADTGQPRKIIAKIETKLAVKNIESIMAAADAVMVARGDLAVETPLESVPIVQRNIIGLGLNLVRPTIVATQMLASMTDSPEPTRAEVSDVASAVIIGADAVMLSEETAAGKYPIPAVKTMKRVIRYTEANAPLRAPLVSLEDRPVSRELAISRSVISLAENIRATAIVAETKSGATARHIAALRPRIPLLAVTDDTHTAQELAIVYGVKGFVRPVSSKAAARLTDWLLANDVLHPGDVVVSASGKYPGVIGTTDTIKVRQLD